MLSITYKQSGLPCQSGSTSNIAVSSAENKELSSPVSCAKHVSLAHKFARFVSIVGLSILPCFGQSINGVQFSSYNSYAHDHRYVENLYPDEPSHWLKTFYWASAAYMIAGQGLDMASSYHRGVETNGLLRPGNSQQFGAAGIGIKSGLVGGSLLIGFLGRHHASVVRATAIGDLALGTVGTVAAVHNYGVSTK